MVVGRGDKFGSLRGPARLPPTLERDTRQSIHFMFYP